MSLQDVARLVVVAAPLVQLGDLAERGLHRVVVAASPVHPHERFTQRDAVRQALHGLGARSERPRRVAELELGVDQCERPALLIGEGVAQALRDAGHAFGVPACLYLFEQRAEFLEGLVAELLSEQELREPKPVGHVGGIERRNALEQIEGLALEPAFLTGGDGLLELPQRIRSQAHALEVVPEVDASLEAAAVDLQDLFVDGDGLGIEAALRELLGNLTVGLDGRDLIPSLEVQIAELEPSVGVFGLDLQVLQVLLQGLVIRALLYVLLRLVQRLSFERKRQDWSSHPFGRGPPCPR